MNWTVAGRVIHTFIVFVLVTNDFEGTGLSIRFWSTKLSFRMDY